MKLVTTVMLLALAVGSTAWAEPALPDLPPLMPLADPVPNPALTVAAFRRALAAGDAAAAADVLTFDAVIFEEGHAETFKSQYVNDHLPADLRFAQATSFEVTYQMTGENGGMGYVATEGRTRGEFDGKPVDSISTETVVLRREGQGWKIVHIHWSSRPAPVEKD